MNHDDLPLMNGFPLEEKVKGKASKVEKALTIHFPYGRYLRRCPTLYVKNLRGSRWVSFS